MKWELAGHSIDCSKPVFMGIVNVTPDSFSDSGKFFNQGDAVAHALKLVSDGADILDIGGESTRPGSEPITIDIEIERVIPVIRGIREAGIAVPISIDTRKLEVAEKAVDAGAVIINDVTALGDDPGIGDLVAEKNLGLVLMHMQGRPQSMQENPHYDDVIAEISEFFIERVDFAQSCGVKPENIVLDPGIGFGKLLEHNLTIIAECGRFLEIGRPVLIGTSRKRFIGEILGCKVNKRLFGTIGSCVAALYSGARIFRVHDVGPVREAIEVAWSVLKSTREIPVKHE